MSKDEAKLREVIGFWRQFVEEWEQIIDEPVPPSILEALDQAEFKLQNDRSG